VLSHLAPPVMRRMFAFGSCENRARLRGKEGECGNPRSDERSCRHREPTGAEPLPSRRHRGRILACHRGVTGLSSSRNRNRPPQA
jgi:hypothetical protein